MRRGLAKISLFLLAMMMLGLTLINIGCEEDEYGKVTGVRLPTPTPVPVITEREPNDYAIETCNTSNSLGWSNRDRKRLTTIDSHSYWSAYRSGCLTRSIHPTFWNSSDFSFSHKLTSVSGNTPFSRAHASIQADNSFSTAK